LQDKNIEIPYGVCMLLPTSPLRTYKHINGALERFLEGHDSVISICATKPLYSLRKITNDKLEPLVKGTLNKQRQEVDQLYQVNGSIYIAKSEILLNYKTFHIPEAVPYKMGTKFSVDIDTQEDLDLVRAML